MSEYNSYAWYQPGFNCLDAPKQSEAVRCNPDGSFYLILGPGVVEDYSVWFETLSGESLLDAEACTPQLAPVDESHVKLTLSAEQTAAWPAVAILYYMYGDEPAKVVVEVR